MSAPNWPQINTVSKLAKKRAGGSYSQFVSRSETRMPCGHAIKVNKRHTDKDNAEAMSRMQAHREGGNHLTAHGCGHGR